MNNIAVPPRVNTEATAVFFCGHGITNLSKVFIYVSYKKSSAASQGVSPSKFFISSDEEFLGTGLSTSTAALVDRQSVRVPDAKLCFATGSKIAPLFLLPVRDSNPNNILQRDVSYH